MTAFRATYADWKLIKSRSVVQVIFEVPLHEADAAYEVLGGMPAPAAEQWFGIAALTKEVGHEVIAAQTASPRRLDKPAGAKRDWRDLPPAQQAGIRCEEPSFEAFLKEERSDDWHESQDAAECVRLICGVSTRADLGTNHKARVIWTQLNSQFEAWKVREHA